MGEWIRTNTCLLIAHNHRLPDIGNYTLSQFLGFIDEVQRADAQTRLAFTIDMSVAAHSVLGGGGALSEHIDSLKYAALGE